MKEYTAQLPPGWRRRRLLRVLHRQLRQRDLPPVAASGTSSSRSTTWRWTGSFNEFQVIVCRNVMIYFNRTLQARVLDLFSSSLVRLGFLVPRATRSRCSGTPGEAAYEEFVDGRADLPEGARRDAIGSVVVGASFGGFDALKVVLGALAGRFPAAARDRPAPGRPGRIGCAPAPALHAARRGGADDKEPLLPGRRLPRPAGLPPAGRARRPGPLGRPAVLYARPSIDVLFESAADVYGASVDRRRPDRYRPRRRGRPDPDQATRRHGIVQDPATAIRAAMPEAALARAGSTGSCRSTRSAAGWCDRMLARARLQAPQRRSQLASRVSHRRGSNVSVDTDAVNILLVDDEPKNLTALSAVLDGRGGGSSRAQLGRGGASPSAPRGLRRDPARRPHARDRRLRHGRADPGPREDARTRRSSS